MSKPVAEPKGISLTPPDGYVLIGRTADGSCFECAEIVMVATQVWRNAALQGSENIT